MTDFEIQPLEKITSELLSQQHQRILALGTIKVITDVETEKVYLVPIESTHKKLVEELKKEAKNKLVPSYINLETNKYGPFKITGVLTGLSGKELAGEIRYWYKDLQKAHKIVWNVINASSLPLEICIKTDKIETKYAV